MSKEKYIKGKRHVQIGSIGHVGYGKTDLMKAISKALAEKELDKDETVKPEISSVVDEKVTLDNAHKEIDNLRR